MHNKNWKKKKICPSKPHQMQPQTRLVTLQWNHSIQEVTPFLSVHKWEALTSKSYIFTLRQSMAHQSAVQVGMQCINEYSEVHFLFPSASFKVPSNLLYKLHQVTKLKCFLSRLAVVFAQIHWSQVFSREWRCSWSSTDRWCSNYIWVINNFIVSWDVSYTIGLMVCILNLVSKHSSNNMSA